MLTDLPEERQGPALVLSLEGEAQDAVLELSEADNVKENGVDLILARLDKLYKNDSQLQSFKPWNHSKHLGDHRVCLFKLF